MCIRDRGEHQRQPQEGSVGGTDGAPPLDEEVVHDAVADGTRHHGDHAALRLFGHNVHACLLYTSEACEVHGVNCDELLEKLNTHLAAKKA